MKSSQILSYYISTFTMTVIAFDRYRIVHYPLGARMKPWRPISLIWAVSTVFVLPTMVSMRISEYFTPKRLIYCRIVFPSSLRIFSTAPFRKFRATFVLVTQYIIPSVISVIFYALCLKKLILRKRIGQSLDLILLFISLFRLSLMNFKKPVLLNLFPRLFRFLQCGSRVYRFDFSPPPRLRPSL